MLCVAVPWTPAAEPFLHPTQSEACCMGCLPLWRKNKLVRLQYSVHVHVSSCRYQHSLPCYYYLQALYMYIVVSIVALKLNPKVKKISTTIIMLLSCVTVKD